MLFLVVVAALTQTVKPQYQTSTNQQQSADNNLYYAAAPLHYVTIGSQLAGDYKFGYDTGKGPMGQSFREEMRLADGSVKGSYGMADENGLKGIVHYSAGKTNFISERDPKISNSPTSTQQQQSNVILQQNFNSLPQQFHVFKPTNYLQSRSATMELIPQRQQTEYKKIPSKTVNMKSPQQQTEYKNVASTAITVEPFPQRQTEYENAVSRTVNVVPIPQRPAEYKNIVSSIEMPKKMSVRVKHQKTVPSSYRLPIPARPANTPATENRLPIPVRQANVAAVPENRLPVPKQQEQVTQSPGQSQTLGLSNGQMNSMSALAEMYKSLKRVTKKPIVVSKQPQIDRRNLRKIEEQSYNSKTDEDYYYDSAPAFIDIERLSYSVGTDQSSAYVRN